MGKGTAWTLVLLALVTACDRSPMQPEPSAALSCNNPTPTPVQFTVIRAGVPDATATVNHLVEPHHWADTLVIAATPTAPKMLVIAAHGGRCTTLLDSLVFFGPLTWQYRDAP